jgi:hypothetical protein
MFIMNHPGSFDPIAIHIHKQLTGFSSPRIKINEQNYLENEQIFHSFVLTNSLSHAVRTFRESIFRDGEVDKISKFMHVSV